LAQLVRAIEPHRADEIAATILRRFGSLAKLVAASPATLLKNIDNATLASVLPAAKYVILEASREGIMSVKYDLHDARFVKYFTTLLGQEAAENFHAIFLDVYHRVIHDERIARGGWTQVDVPMRYLLRRAIDHNAANLVLVHNHPSGIATPSEDDLALTRRAQEAAALLGITVVDHLIVAGEKVFSMAQADLL
jgi:DNA repair protein RadC